MISQKAAAQCGVSFSNEWTEHQAFMHLQSDSTHALRLLWRYNFYMQSDTHEDNQRNTRDILEPSHLLLPVRLSPPSYILTGMGKLEMVLRWPCSPYLFRQTVLTLCSRLDVSLRPVTHCTRLASVAFLLRLSCMSAAWIFLCPTYQKRVWRGAAPAARYREGWSRDIAPTDSNSEKWVSGLSV